MPRGAWTPKDERKYKAIVKSCKTRGGKSKVCKRIAAATVNRDRKRRRRKGLGSSCGCGA